MSTMKEIIIGQMDKGPEILTDIRYTRMNALPHSTRAEKTSQTIAKLHREILDLEVSEIYQITPEAKTFRLVAREGILPPFEAGQYLNIFAEIEGVRTSRPYSISSSPRQRAYYDITIAGIQGGFVSQYFLDKVKPGDRFEASSPAGQFKFNPVFHSKKQLFLAGGSGVTPFMSMLREALDSGLDREIHLVYGSRSVETAFFHEELQGYAARHDNFTYTLVISDDKANPEWKGRRGFIDAPCLKESAGDITDRTCYICGPPIMYDFCIKALEELKVPPRMIRREMFGARQDIQNEPGWPSELTGKEVFTWKVGDKTMEARSDESLLAALERAGIRMNVCCRSGECSLCRVKLVSGRVFQPRGALLRYADEKYGYIHSCKSYPISDGEIIL